MALSGLRPADLRGARTPGQLAVHGDTVIYTLRVVDGRGERIDLWQVGRSGAAARRLTESPGRDTSPRLAPDGSAVAFLRSADGPSQIYLLALDGTQPRRLTDARHGVHDLAWYPDGDALVALVEDDTADTVHGGTGDQSPTCLVLRRLDWRADGAEAGMRLRPQHLHRVPVRGGEPRRLTGGAWSASRPRVAADGTVHLIADPGPDADLDPCPQVHRIAPDGSLVTVTDLAGGVRRYHLTEQTGPAQLAVLGYDAPRRDALPPRWFDASGQPLGPDGEHWVGLLGEETDLFDWTLEADDTSALTTVSRGGSTLPVEIHDGRALVAEPALTGAVAGPPDRPVAVLARAGRAPAPDIYALDAAGPRRLTDHGDWLAPHVPPGGVEVMTVPGPAGDITVHLLAPTEPPAGPLPTVLAVHGGPTAQWGVVPSIEALVLAGAGYLVAMPNIRGSIDRGPHWVAALGGDWGGADAADCHAVCDHLVTAGRTDPARLGVSGLSYGGFLTQWLIGTSDRFAAAAAENGVTNQITAWAECAEGPTYNRSAGLADPLSPEGAAQLWSRSPLRHAARITTPLLMLQAADDRTCPAADNEQLFVALRALRREVEYVLYPEESHLMQGTGRIDRRIDRHERVLAWFRKYMPA